MTLGRVVSAVTVVLIVAVLGLSARLDPAELNPIVYTLTGFSYVCFIALIGPTLIRPRIGALSERTFIGFVISFLGTVSSIIVYNTDHERILFDAQTAALLFREAIIAVLLVPTVWLVLFVTGRLGQGDR